MTPGTHGGGYSDPAYAEALAEWGRVMHLPSSGASLLVRAVAGTPEHDAIAPYPLLACADWSRLPEDLATIEQNVVSVTGVADPLADVTEASLREAFPDLLRPYKEHFVVELDGDWRRSVRGTARRSANQALARLDVDVVSTPSVLLDDWCRLYAGLVDRHRIEGIAAFSRHSFAAQLELPGMVALRAADASGSTLAIALWLRDGVRAWYHLSAQDEAGRQLGAAHALMSTALHHFAEAGVHIAALGAGPGVDPNATDGLTTFKRGWSGSTRTAWLCGRIVDHHRYRELVTRRGPGRPGHFPAYRGHVATEPLDQPRP